MVIDLLKAEVLPTMGCTEPGAVALAAAHAGKALGDAAVEKIEVMVNGNVYKNGVAVGIPGTGETGMHIAAALGAALRCPERQLSVLADIPADKLAAARRLVKEKRVAVGVDGGKSNLWIQVTLTAGAHTSRALIEDKHTNLTHLEKDGVCLFEKAAAGPGREADDFRAVLRQPEVTLAGMIHTVEEMTLAELEFVLEGVEMNVKAAQQGIEKHLGMGIGAAYQDMVNKGLISEDLFTYAKMITAAAADARMSGESIPIMSSAGSGNHGITVILPVYAAAKKLGAAKEDLAKAVAISHLVTVYIKMHTGSLSALCGCAIAAAAGATAAIAWLMKGSTEQVGAAVKNIIGNLSGMICDGGKVGCALKLSTAAEAAVSSSVLAMQNIVVPDTNGIVAHTVEQTIRNLGRVSNPGMVATDKMILDVMLEKSADEEREAGV